MMSCRTGPLRLATPQTKTCLRVAKRGHFVTFIPFVVVFGAWVRALPGWGIYEEFGGGWSDEWHLGGWGGCCDLQYFACFA